MKKLLTKESLMYIWRKINVPKDPLIIIQNIIRCIRQRKDEKLAIADGAVDFRAGMPMNVSSSESRKYITTLRNVLHIYYMKKMDYGNN